jgi:putative DNA primase/helicase
MTTTDQCNTSSPPTLTDHINFADVGVGPEGQRFIRITIDVGDEQREVLLPYDGFVSGSRAALAQLNKHGAHLISSKAASEFLMRLQGLGPQEPSFKVATRVGPFGDAFVLPDTVISASDVKVETRFDDGLADYLSWGREGGTLEGWRQFEALAVGNSRLILALGAAFVGPLRLITPIEPVAFHLTGLGGTGKTTIGAVASSVWGQRLQLGQPHPLCAGDSLKNTVNNLERVLATRNYTFAFLNEGHHISAKDLVDAIFMICEGQGKGRYTEVCRWDWFLSVLASSNESVAETLRKAGEPLERAAFDRLIDIPLPQGKFGAFENLHGSATVGDFHVRLQAIYDVEHGVVGRDYVFKILQELAKDSEELAAWVQSRREAFIRAATRSVSADPDHGRVISHFATVYAALQLAADYDLFCLPKGSAGSALLTLLRDHLRVTASEIARVVAASPEALLKAYVQQHRASFVTLNGAPLPRGHVHAACPGYIYEASGREWLGFTASLLERVLGGRSARDALCRQLDSRGLIRKVGGGEDGPRYATKVRVGGKREYLHCFDSSLFD